jgi:rhamnosyltransferase
MSGPEAKMVSLLVPTHNGAATLAAFFAAVRRQDRQPDEILVADTASGDATVALCQAHGATVLPLTKAEFDHGGTRAALARQASGDILVFCTQDALLAGRESLSRLVAPLLADPTVACSYGRQLPHAGASPFAAHLRHFNYPPLSACRQFSDRQQLGLRTVFISNSFAAYARGPLLTVGYFKNNLIFGEDTCTLGRLLLAGYRVAYVSEAEVYHSHNYSFGEEFRRSFDIGVLHSLEPWLLRIFGRATGIGRRYGRSVLATLWRGGKYHLLPDCALRLAAKAVGYSLGRAHHKLPPPLRRKLSLNRAWWDRNLC